MAIVYSYPKVTSPLATDVLVLTDTTVTAGKRKNKTKSIAMSDVATYVINSKSGITGTGTLNTFPIFTASTIIGDSIITQAATGQGITVGGSLIVTDDTSLQGSLLTDSLEVNNDSVFTGSARFNGTIKDTSGGVGTNGQVLTSTGTGVAWTTDAGGSVTGTGTTNYIAKWDTSSSIQDSIIFDNGTNVGIGTATPSAKLHVNGQTAFLVTDGNETGLEINNGSYIYKIGDISGGENQAYMQIDSAASKAFFLNSNVGIGTNSPTNKLDVYGNIGINNSIPKIILKDTDTNTIAQITANSSNLTYSTVATSRDHIFKADANNLMIIEGTGNVGIGTTSPSAKLDVKSSGSNIDEISLTHSGNTVKIASLGQESNHGSLVLRNNSGTIQTRLSAGGNNSYILNSKLGIGTTSPYGKLNVIPSSNPTTPTTANQIAIGESSANSWYNLRLGYFLQGGAYRGSIQSIAGNIPHTLVLNGDGGNVGIGTTSPVEKLVIASSVNNDLTTLRIENNFGSASGNGTGTALQFYGWDAGIAANIKSIRTGQNYSPSALTFETYGGNGTTGTNSLSERMRIDDFGNVGIGRSSSITARLFVEGPTDTATISTSSTPAARINNGGAISNWIGSNGYNYGYIQSIQDDGSNNLKPLSLQPLGNNVGIGTTSPGYLLDVSGDIRSTSYVRADDAFIGNTIISTGNQDFAINKTTAYSILLNTNGSEKMRITSGGNVGIGTTSPGAKLQIGSASYAPNANLSNNLLQIKSPGGVAYLTIGNGDTANATSYIGGASGFILLGSVTDAGATSEHMRIVNTGNVGIGTTSPASKLTVTGGDAEVTGSDKGLILESPNGTRYRIKVDNSGNLTTTAV